METRRQELYDSKKISVEQALGMIKSGDDIVAGFFTTEPVSILSRLHTIRNRVEDVTLWSSLVVGSYEFFHNPEMKGHISTGIWFFTQPIRAAHRTGLVSLEPGHMHNGYSRHRVNKKPNIFISTVSPMDRHGFVGTSLTALSQKRQIEDADLVIMEVNPRLPFVHGETEIPIEKVDYFIEVDRPIPVAPRTEITETEKIIGEYVSTLVNDGDTIQLGIGGIPDAAAQAFFNKKDLGVHTEMITSSIASLAKAGVITGQKKNLHHGKIVGLFAYGTQELYDFLDGNPSVSLMPDYYVNNPFVVAQNDNMVSVNTTLQVDLTGQICSETIGHRQFSGTGGQNDMAEGAIHAKNGRSIIALKSVTKGGTISTIQPFLSQGAVVSLSRNNVDYIVTEYGIAYLKGRTIRQRVENLIAVAHPDFRKELRDAAVKYEIW